VCLIFSITIPSRHILFLTRHKFYIFPVKELKETCAKGLQISNDNCIELMALADMHGAMALKRAAIAHIRKNAATLIFSPLWGRRISALSLLHKEIVVALVI
jgi:hypothetical protein